MLPILQLGPLAIPLPGLLIIGGFWFATLTLTREEARNNLPANTLSNIILIGLIGGIIGARLSYVLRHLDVYADAWLGIFSLDTNSFMLADGLLIGLIAALIYTQRKAIPLWPTLDALTPAVALFFCFIGLSHLASGNAYGAPTSVPWSLLMWGAERHPSQLYEIAAAILLFGTVSWLKFSPTFPGFLFLTFSAFSAASQVFLEAFRGDSLIIFAGLRSMQVLGLIVLFLSLIGLHLLAMGAREKNSVP